VLKLLKVNVAPVGPIELPIAGEIVAPPTGGTPIVYVVAEKEVVPARVTKSKRHRQKFFMLFS